MQNREDSDGKRNKNQSSSFLDSYGNEKNDTVFDEISEIRASFSSDDEKNERKFKFFNTDNISICEHDVSDEKNSYLLPAHKSNDSALDKSGIGQSYPIIDNKQIGFWKDSPLCSYNKLSNSIEASMNEVERYNSEGDTIVNRRAKLEVSVSEKSNNSFSNKMVRWNELVDVNEFDDQVSMSTYTSNSSNLEDKLSDVSVCIRDCLSTLYLCEGTESILCGDLPYENNDQDSFRSCDQNELKSDRNEHDFVAVKSNSPGKRK